MVVSLDSDVDDARRFAEENGIEFPILLDPKTQVAALFGVDVIPLNFVLDGSGRVTAVQEGYPGNGWLVGEVEKILGEPLEVEPSAEPAAKAGGSRVLIIVLAVVILSGAGIFLIVRSRRPKR